MWKPGMIGLTACPIVLAAASTTQVQVPADWLLYEGVPATNAPERICAMRSTQHWLVGLEEGRLVAAPLAMHERRRDQLPYAIDFSGAIDIPPPLPPGVEHQYDRREWARAYARDHAGRRVAMVPGGWLVGFDGGEYGGSLWWYPLTPAAGRKLWDGNVQEIIFQSLSEPVVVLTGLAHGDSHGAVLSLVPSGDTAWTVVKTSALKGAPEVWVTDAQGDIIVATTASVEKIDWWGNVVTLSTVDYAGLYPSSIVLGPGGEIAVGLRIFVNVLRPAPTGYEQEWYIPGSCTQRRLLDFDCECTGVAGESQ